MSRVIISIKIYTSTCIYFESFVQVCWETCLDNTCDINDGGCNACTASPKGVLCRDQGLLQCGL